MGTSKGFFLAVTVTSATLLLLGIGTLGAKPDKPNPHKPVPATDIVLVPKITLQGCSGAARSGQRRTGAATGVLGAQCGGTRYAIVIGISDYPGALNDLDYADDDAVVTTEVLSSIYGFDDITTLIDKNATRESVLDAIDRIRALASSADEVVFFYSGHGMSGDAMDGDREKVDEAIVVNPLPSNTDPFADYEPIWDGELEVAFRNFPTSRVIFIFDMCMAGGMNDLLAPGRVLLMAAGERADAYEGPDWGGGQGEFSYYLAEGMSTGVANVHDYADIGVLSNPPLVTIEEAFDYAKANCVEDSPVIGDSFLYDLLP